MIKNSAQVNHRMDKCITIANHLNVTNFTNISLAEISSFGQLIHNAHVGFQMFGFRVTNTFVIALSVVISVGALMVIQDLITKSDKLYYLL